MGRTPVASGASVPAWPTRFWPSRRRTSATASKDVTPAALSSGRTPVMLSDPRARLASRVACFRSAWLRRIAWLRTIAWLRRKGFPNGGEDGAGDLVQGAGGREAGGVDVAAAAEA